MKLLDRLSSVGRVISQFATRAYNMGPVNLQDIGYSALSRFSTMPRRNTHRWLKSYGEEAVLQTPVGRLATDFAAVRWMVVKRDPKTGIRTDVTNEHPLGKLLHTPNTWHGGTTLRFLTCLYWELVGESFWVMERPGPNAPPRELWPVPPSWVVNKPSLDHFAYTISFRGHTVDLPPSEVIWMHIPDPWDPFGRGLGPAYCLEDLLQQWEYAAKWNSNWFRNGAVPTTVIGVPGSDRTVCERIEKDWDRKYGGLWRSHKPAFINSDIRVSDLSKGQKDMDFVEMLKYIRDTVIQLWGIPREIIGTNQASSQAATDSAIYSYSQLQLIPRLNRMREELNRLLVPMYGDPTIEIDYENPVRDTEEFKLRQASELGSRGFLTRGEVRVRCGYPLLGDKRDDEILQPANILGVDRDGNTIVAGQAQSQVQPGGPDHNAQRVSGATNGKSLYAQLRQILEELQAEVASR